MNLCLTLLLGISYIIWIDQRNGVFVGGIIVLAYHLLQCNSLRINYEKIERFIKGEEPKKILED